jgi:hypothetical protein
VTGLRVIGAGVSRTGTTSLKLALERLLDGPCYHMYEVLRHPDHVARWQAAVDGGPPAWDRLYAGFVATVDFPGAAFWSELHRAYPEALVLLSVRESGADWFRSVGVTVDPLMRRRPRQEQRAWHAMVTELLRTRFTPVPFEETSAVAAYERHNAEVRAGVPAEQLLEWRVTDGWGPLCERLRVPVPAEPFPHVNTLEDFRDFLDRTRSPSWRERIKRRWRSGHRSQPGAVDSG